MNVETEADLVLADFSDCYSRHFLFPSLVMQSVVRAADRRSPFISDFLACLPVLLRPKR